MKKLTRKLIAISIVGLLPALSMQVNAQNNKLIIPQYDNGTLINAGCEPQVWNQMVNDYTAKRGLERGLQFSTIQEQYLSTPAAKGPTSGASGGAGSCFQSATNNINSAMQGVNALMSIFSGGFDFSALASGVANQLGQAACREIDSRLGQMTGGLTGQLNTATYGVTSTITGASINTGTSAGSINVGQYATSANNTTGNQIPYISTNGINNATAPYVAQGQTAVNGATSQAGSFFQSLNPFRQNPQSTPDPLK